MNILVSLGIYYFFFFSFLVFAFAMRLLQVRASPSGQRRETFPFKSPWETQQGQVNGPLHRESHRQGLFILMFIDTFVGSFPVGSRREGEAHQIFG